MAVKAALHRCQYNISETAKALGVCRTPLYRLMEEYQPKPEPLGENKAAPRSNQKRRVPLRTLPGSLLPAAAQERIRKRTGKQGLE